MIQVKKHKRVSKNKVAMVRKHSRKGSAAYNAKRNIPGAKPKKPLKNAITKAAFHMDKPGMADWEKVTVRDNPSTIKKIATARRILMDTNEGSFWKSHNRNGKLKKKKQ